MVTETQHLRSRRAALAGLVLQIAATLAVVGLWMACGSAALASLRWYMASGIPIWFVVLLVLRQRELAALEALDLEALKQERAASGGGESLFAEQAGQPGFRVAHARLEWMERWLVPAFSLVAAALLIVSGVLVGQDVRRYFVVEGLALPEMQNVDIGFILLSVLVVLLFFFSRFASGLARVPQWQLLRGCGSFVIGNALATALIAVGFALRLYRGDPGWDHALALIIPGFQVLLGAEIVINLVADVYRPRTAGVIPRAAFDSRITGLLSEPGGIAQSVAEAINYQFGFQVSQSWFYQLLQRTFVWLVGVGALILWVMTCVVVVHPGQHVIVSRFGNQRNAQQPMGPGIHLKLPYPIETVDRFETGRLFEFVVGYSVGDLPEPESAAADARPVVELWTDKTHGGREHFNFIIAPTPASESESTSSTTAPAIEGLPGAQAQRAPVHLLRMHTVVQYRIPPEALAEYTQRTADPHDLLRQMAWEEVSKYVATATVDELMGSRRDELGGWLAQRLTQRIGELALGLEIVHVGALGIHPEATVAAAFRSVVTAQLDKVAEIRKARVTEDQTLTQVAGDVGRALALSFALQRRYEADSALLEAERRAREAGWPIRPADEAQFDELQAVQEGAIRATWTLTQMRQEAERAQLEYSLGMGRSLDEIERYLKRVDDAQAEAHRAQAERDAAFAKRRDALAPGLPPGAAEALADAARARFASRFWSAQIDGLIPGLEGEAAVKLAQAQAQRWNREMSAAGEVIAVTNERYAFYSAPRIYKVRSYLQVLVEGLSSARKYFLAFDPEGRDVHLRIEAQDQARPDLISTQVEGTP